LLIPCAAQERSSIKALHDSLFSSTTGELKALDLAPDFNDTLWAACMVNSRCFSDAAGRELLSLMVPLADMANHSNTPNAGFKLNPGTQTFSIISTKVRTYLVYERLGQAGVYDAREPSRIHVVGHCGR
jgi:hypothetical protein